MAIREWETLLSSLRIVRGKVFPVDIAEIRQFEKSTGFILPEGYCEYCQVFGAGFLADPLQYTIAVPGGKSFRLNLEQYSTRYKHYFDRSTLKNLEQFERAWFFSTDTFEANYYWDPFEITQSKNSEYAIYVLYDSSLDNKSEKIADTLWDFVNNICLGGGPPAYRDCGADPTFFPFDPDD